MDTRISNIDERINNLFVNGSILETIKRRAEVLDAIPKGLFDKSRGERKFIKKGYNTNIIILYKGIHSVLSIDRCSSTLPYARWTSHFSKHVNFSESFEYLSDLVNRDFAIYIFYLSSLKRLDLCIDLESLNYEQLKKMAHRSKVRWMIEFISTNESKYFGVLACDSFQLIIYEKKDCIRVEARFTGKQVPIARIIDILKLRDFYPFKKVSFFCLDSTALKLDELTDDQKSRVLKFTELYDEFGYTKARIKMNNKRNFSRSVQPYLFKAGMKEIFFEDEWKQKFDEFCDCEERYVVSSRELQLVQNKLNHTPQAERSFKQLSTNCLRIKSRLKAMRTVNLKLVEDSVPKIKYI